MTPKFRKRILLLTLSVIGGSVIGSIVATEIGSKAGTLRFQHKELEKTLTNFVSASNMENGEAKNLTPVSLVTELAKNPNSIPLLMSGFATQVAKSIFDESLYKSTKYPQLGKSLANSLKGIKAQASGAINAQRKSSTRVKKNWISDEEKYLTKLKDFILGKIDLSSIDSYYQLKDHNFTSIKTIPPKTLPLIGFLMARWVDSYKAGYYVHQVLPYSDKFQDSTKNLYTEKYKNVNLPEKPDFYFPDFDPENIEKFEKAIELWEGGEKTWWDVVRLNTTATEKEKKAKEELKKQSAVHFVSSSNTSQKNLALQYLTLSDSSSKTSSDANSWQNIFIHLYRSVTRNVFKNKQHNCQSSSAEAGTSSSPDMTKLSDIFLDLKRDPLKLFCITKESTENTEFLIHISSSKDKKSSQKEQKIVFWRDHKGFNVLLPVTQETPKTKVAEQDVPESKEAMVNSFKDYVKNNFSYLLLKYFLFIKGCNNGQQPKECCEEIIKNLVSIWELSRQLTDFNNTLKIWDNRSRNNANLKMVDYSQDSNYFSKLGTVSANPPSFLEKLKKQDEIKRISSSIKTHLEKIEKYFSGEGAQNQGKKAEGASNNLEAKQKGGSGGAKYWTFNESNGKAQKECMKHLVAEYLLEKIHSHELLKKYLLLPVSFENFSKETSNSSSQGQSGDSKLEKILSEDYKKVLGLSSSSGRSKRQAEQQQNKKLIDLLNKAIEKELVNSKLNQISDTFLFKLVSGSGQEKNGGDSNNFETIKDWLTIGNLLNQPLRKDNTLEKSKLRLLITAMFLMEDSLREYREVLKSIVKKEFFGTYAYSLSWNKFCVPDETKNPMDPATGNGTQRPPSNGNTSFWTPIKVNSEEPPKKPETNSKQEWNSTLDPRNCIRNQDRYSTSSIKKASAEQSQQQVQQENNGTVEMMGYKGSISKASQLQLPGNLYEQILDFLLKEGYIKLENIKQQVDLIKTNRQFSDFIKQLTKSKSSIGWAFELPDYRTLKEDFDQSKKAEALEWFGLNKKKELLKTFIDKYWAPSTSSSSPVVTTTTTVSSESTTSQNSQDKQSFQGLMWNSQDTIDSSKKSYIFNTKDENEGSAAVYLIQYTADDLKDEKSFKDFIEKKLTPDMLIQDIVKKALSPGLQTRAINHYLMRGTWATGDKVYNLTSNDHYLKDQFLSIIL